MPELQVLAGILGLGRPFGLVGFAVSRPALYNT